MIVATLEQFCHYSTRQDTVITGYKCSREKYELKKKKKKIIKEKGKRLFERGKIKPVVRPGYLFSYVTPRIVAGKQNLSQHIITL